MKKVLLFVAALCISYAGISQSNAIKINILSPVIKVGNLQFEHVLNDKSSLQLGIFYGAISSDGTLGEGVKLTGFGITPEYRFYLGENSSPDGFFVAPFFRYRSFKFTDTIFNDEATLSAIGGGAIIGRQWLFSEKVTFEVFIGPQYTSSTLDITSGTGDSFDTGVFDGFGIRSGLTLGFAF